MTLSCPSCGLVLTIRGPQVEYCPRCIAKRRQPVPLIAKGLMRAGGEAEPAGGAAASATQPPRRRHVPG